MTTWNPTPTAATATATKPKKEYRPAKVLAGKLYWAKDAVQIQEPNKKYQVRIGNLSTKAIEWLEGEGVNVLDREDFARNIVLKSNNPIDIFGPDGEKLDPNTVGNGSSVQVKVTTYEWKPPYNGISASLIGNVSVTDLITYEAESRIEDEEVF